jgi:hypothetical protein
MVQINLKRFQDVYDELVDQTEERLTIYDKKRHDRLSDLLQLFEYLRGEDEENPMNDWFPSS